MPTPIKLRQKFLQLIKSFFFPPCVIFQSLLIKTDYLSFQIMFLQTTDAFAQTLWLSPGVNNCQYQQRPQCQIISRHQGDVIITYCWGLAPAPREEQWSLQSEFNTVSDGIMISVTGGDRQGGWWWSLSLHWLLHMETEDEKFGLECETQATSFKRITVWLQACSPSPSPSDMRCCSVLLECIKMTLHQSAVEFWIVISQKVMINFLSQQLVYINALILLCYHF